MRDFSLHLNMLPLCLPSFKAKRGVQGFNWSRDTNIRWERWERRNKNWRQRAGNSGAEQKMQTTEREGKLIEMKLGQDKIDTHSPYNSLIKLYLNCHRAAKTLFFPFCCSLLQFEQLHRERGTAYRLQSRTRTIYINVLKKAGGHSDWKQDTKPKQGLHWRLRMTN